MGGSFSKIGSRLDSKLLNPAADEDHGRSIDRPGFVSMASLSIDVSDSLSMISHV